MAYLRAQGRATSTWSFIQSTPAKDKLVSSLCDAHAESLAGIRKTEGAILRYERVVEVVNIWVLLRWGIKVFE